MIASFIKSARFRTLMKFQIRDLLRLLVAQETHFSILCVFKDVDFYPEIPQELTTRTDELILFTLAGFTFESIKLGESDFSFEAGFGRDNVAALLTIPYSSIAQVLLHNIELLTNMSLPAIYKYSLQNEEDEKANLQNSLEALLSNPHNSSIFKKDK